VRILKNVMVIGREESYIVLGLRLTGLDMDSILRRKSMDCV
jgi:hypothetical protein